MSGYQKLNNLLGLKKLVGNKGGLEYMQADHNTVSTFKIIFVPTTNQPKYVANLEHKNKDILG